jgi:dTDP-4-amino-4,6-dideoxygalactose transaminase
MANLAINGGTPVRTTPFLRWPLTDERDQERLLTVLKSGQWSSDGPMEREFEQRFARRHDADVGTSVSNGTISLLLCLRALDIKPGDEVIVPALTWIATATSVLEANGVPVFADVDPKTLCLDAAAVEAAITPRTVAVIPVHLYSAMADMAALSRICEARGLALIEDCAHAHGAAFGGKGAGSFGAFGSFSFQSSKVMTAGEGGLITSAAGELSNKIYSHKNCGRVVEGRGKVVLGGNHRLSEWQQAILLGQLDRLDEQRAHRDQSIAALTRLLSEVPGVEAQASPPGVTSRPHYRLVLHYDKAKTNGLPIGNFVEAVRAEGVPLERTYGVVYDHPAYLPEATSWYSQRVQKKRCTVAEEAAAEKVCTVPHQILLGSQKDLEDVATAIQKVVQNGGDAATAVSRLKAGVKALVRKLPRNLT